MDKWDKVGFAVGIGFTLTVMGFVVYILVKVAISLG